MQGTSGDNMRVSPALGFELFAANAKTRRSPLSVAWFSCSLGRNIPILQWKQSFPGPLKRHVLPAHPRDRSTEARPLPEPHPLATRASVLVASHERESSLGQRSQGHGSAALTGPRPPQAPSGPADAPRPQRKVLLFGHHSVLPAQQRVMLWSAAKRCV